MAGKQVRCKQCGNIFALPGGEAPDGASDLDALAAIERTFSEPETDPASVRRYDDAVDASEEDAVPIRAGRTNVRYRFAYAQELDQWLPWILTLGSLGLITAVSYNLDETGVGWMPVLRALSATVAYTLFIAPVTLALIRVAGRKMRFQMPVADRWRAFASYLPGAALAYMLWALGRGDLVALVLGCLAGITVASGLMALLFRLYPLEIAPTSAYAGIGFLLGTAIAGGVFLGANTLLVQIMVSMKSPEGLPRSPFGPGFAWISEEQRLALLEELHPRPKPPPIPPDQVTALPPPPTPLAASAALTIKAAPIVGSFEELIRPLTASPFVAVVKRSGESFNFELWDTSTWTSKAAANLAGNSSPGGNRFVLSPDGDRVARIASFPKRSAQILSIRENRGSRVVYLEEKYGTPELQGFLNRDQLLIRWQRDPSAWLEVLDVEVPKQLQLIEIPSLNSKGVPLAVSRDGALAAIAAKSSGVPTLTVYDLKTGASVTPNPIHIDSLDPSLPVAPTGMAFSFDSRQLAVLFQQGNNGLLLRYNVNPAQNTIEKAAEHIYAGELPAPETRTFSGSSLDWLHGDQAWIIYGQGIFSVANGLKVDQLSVPGVESCRVIRPDAVEVVTRTSGQKQVMLVQLNMPRIRSLLGMPEPATAPTASPAN